MPHDTQSTTPVVRHAAVADAEAIARIFAGPRAIWGTLQIPFPTAEKWRKRLEEGQNAGIFSLVACVDLEPVGILGLHTHPHEPRIRHAASLGMAVRDDWQRRGIGRQLVQAAVDLADDWLGISRLELDVYVDNEPAILLYQRFGFQVEGTKRRAALREGRWVDVLVMARLRETQVP
ncbi:MAG: GNAT family N-acetyltransferase [Verrucomicrobiales bacterium]|nr:GNAT family N-acetyltransferase [Verrucomicrobiales bacterium]